MEKNKNIKIYKWIYSLTEGYRAKILILSFISLLSAAVSVALVIPTKALIDNVSNGNLQKFAFIGAAFLALIVLQTAMHLISCAMLEKTKQKIVMRSRNELLLHILKSNYGSITSYHSGDLISRLMSDIQTAAIGSAEWIPSVLFLIFQFLFSFVILTVFAGKFVLLFIFLFLAITLISLLAKNKIETLHKGVQERYSDNQAFLQDTLTNLLTVKMFSAEERFKEKYENCQKDFLSYRIKRWFFHLSAKSLLGLLFKTGFLLALTVGCLGIFYGKFSFGGFIAILQLIFLVQSPLAELPSRISELYRMKASAKRILEIYSIDEEKSIPFSSKEIYNKLTSIEISGVKFGYTDKYVLKNVSAVIKKGETVAIKGISGCGKSTLFLLLLGAYSVKEGKILLHTKDMTYPLNSEYRKLFAYVPQGNYLFSGTVKENIALFDNNITDSFCEKALKISCAYEFVKALPSGLDTVLKEGGKELSEGQRQRLSIARAVISKAPVLLLDEATCSLDSETEQLILKNIKSLENKTVIIVTHGEAALNICDRVLTLKDGILEESLTGEEI